MSKTFLNLKEKALMVVQEVMPECFAHHLIVEYINLKSQNALKKYKHGNKGEHRTWGRKKKTQEEEDEKHHFIVLL